MPSNLAAWLVTEKANHLEIKTAPYTAPGEDEIVVKVRAVAINPVDWAIQVMGSGLFSFLKYPCIEGSDLAGDVVEIGSSVKRFKAGDRVLGLATGITTGNPSGGAFQEYSVLSSNVASKIPISLSYEEASVLPLGLSTAACGLFQKDYLGLEYPTISPKPSGKTLLIWGGTTSVGCNAIQLAVAAGYEVFTTCSPKNFDYVKKLGASKAFDYSSKSVVEDLLQVLKGKNLAGAYAIGNVNTAGNGQAAGLACLELVDKSEGNKFVAMAMHMPEHPFKGVDSKFVLGSALKDNELGKAIYEDFLPKALAAGKYIAAPEPQIVGKGLEYIQDAFYIQKKGVSAKKVVVSL